MQIREIGTTRTKGWVRRWRNMGELEVASPRCGVGEEEGSSPVTRREQLEGSTGLD